MISIIVGPTGSGKTSLSIEMSRDTGAVIINCDSLQFYKDIPTLTAMPSDAEMAMAPHMLFGFLDCNDAMNAVAWSENVANIIDENDRNVIIVGGTFLYVETLLIGVSNLPNIPGHIRNYVDALSARDFSGMINDLYRIDERIKNTLTPDKHKQLRRAYEIYLTTGRSIFDFYDKPRMQFLSNKNDVEIINIDIDRGFLHERISKRFYEMLKSGAVDEVRELLDKTGNSTDYPVFNAIGAREIASMLSGKIDHDTMVQLSITRTKQYIKRQMTWLRNRLDMYGVPVVKTTMAKSDI